MIMSEASSPQRAQRSGEPPRRVIFEMSNAELAEEQGKLLDAIGVKICGGEAMRETFVRLNLCCGAIAGRLMSVDGLHTKPSRKLEEVCA